MNIDKSELVLKIIQQSIERIEAEEDLSEINNGVRFENYVTIVIEEIAGKYGINVEQTGAQSFPDIIIADTFGIEVKYTSSEKWQSTGNSIFEGTLRKEVTDQIYLFFGRKVGKKVETRCKKYEDCLADIKVTHSPRFFIDMEISNEENILNAIGTSYTDFRSLDDTEKSIRLKNHIRSTLKEGETLWWLDNTQEKAISPKIKEYRKLEAHQKQSIIVESMILFPEIFSNSSTKYLGLSVYPLQEYQIVSSSLRDAFSAGGKRKIFVNGEIFGVSQVFGKLYENAKKIQEKLHQMQIDKLKEFWVVHKQGIASLNDNNKLLQWMRLLDLLAEELPKGLTPRLIFEEGLKDDI